MIGITKQQPSAACLFHSKVISMFLASVVRKERPQPQDWALRMTCGPVTVDLIVLPAFQCVSFWKIQVR
jgi:hypothetical protein